MLKWLASEACLWWLTCLEKIIADLWKLTRRISTKVVNYRFEIFTCWRRGFAEKEAIVGEKETCIFSILGFDLKPILERWLWLQITSLPIKASIQRIKRYGDSGSPWRNQLFYLYLLLGLLCTLMLFTYFTLTIIWNLYLRKNIVILDHVSFVSTLKIPCINFL